MKTTPEKFAKARDSIRIVKPKYNMKIIKWRTCLSLLYNSNKINNFRTK